MISDIAASPANQERVFVFSRKPGLYMCDNTVSAVKNNTPVNFTKTKVLSLVKTGHGQRFTTVQTGMLKLLAGNIMDKFMCFTLYKGTIDDSGNVSWIDWTGDLHFGGSTSAVVAKENGKTYYYLSTAGAGAWKREIAI